MMCLSINEDEISELNNRKLTYTLNKIIMYDN